LRLLLFLKVYLILSQAELAVPDLLLITIFCLHLLDLAIDIEAGLTLLAEKWISSSDLRLVLKCCELNLEHIGVQLLLEMPGRPDPRLVLLGLVLLPKIDRLHLAVRQVEVPIERI